MCSLLRNSREQNHCPASLAFSGDLTQNTTTLQNQWTWKHPVSATQRAWSHGLVYPLDQHYPLNFLWWWKHCLYCPVYVACTTEFLILFNFNGFKFNLFMSSSYHIGQCSLWAIKKCREECYRDKEPCPYYYWLKQNITEQYLILVRKKHMERKTNMESVWCLYETTMVQWYPRVWFPFLFSVFFSSLFFSPVSNHLLLALQEPWFQGAPVQRCHWWDPELGRPLWPPLCTLWADLPGA